MNIKMQQEKIHIQGKNFLKRFFLYWWVVPRVQWDFFDLMYQLYTFEIFHQDWRTKLAHYFTIPAIAHFTMVFFAQWQLDSHAPFINGALIYALVMAIIHLLWAIPRQVWHAGVVTAFFLLVLWLNATCFYEVVKVPNAPWYAPTVAVANPLLWIYVFGLLETLSHTFEDIPPYVNGKDRWESRDTFLRHGGWWRIAGFVSFPTLFTIVSIVSNLHLLPTMILKIMFSVGYRPAIFNRVQNTVDAEVATGNPVIHVFPQK